MSLDGPLLEDVYLRLRRAILVHAPYDGARRNFRISRTSLCFNKLRCWITSACMTISCIPYRINRVMRLNRRVRSKARELADKFVGCHGSYLGASDKERRSAVR